MRGAIERWHASEIVPLTSLNITPRYVFRKNDGRSNKVSVFLMQGLFQLGSPDMHAEEDMRLEPRRRFQRANAAFGFLGLLALFVSSNGRASDGPFITAAFSKSGFETRCLAEACDRRDDGLKLESGWQFANHWSLAALYLDAGHFVASDLTATGRPFEGRVKVQMGAIDGGYTIALGNSLSLLPHLGVARVAADFTPGPAPAIAGDKATMQLLAGLSGRWNFARRLSLCLDWDHTRARMNRENGDVNVASVGLESSF